MRITSTPATGSTVVMDGFRSKTIKAVRTVTIHGDEYRRTFTSTDTEGKTSRYRVTSITVYADGSSWAWAAQLTKAGQPYKNGMGLQMAGTERMAEFYGADILAVVTEAMAFAEARETDHGVALADVSAREYALAHRAPGPFSGPVRGLPTGSVLAGRHLIGTASGLTMRETNTLVDALDVFQAHPILARVLAGILLAE